MKSTEPPSPEQAYRYALRLLAGQDYTAAKLGAKLATRGFAAADIENAVTRLAAEGWLNDRRFAERFAEAAVSSGRFYGPRLRLEMGRRGIPAPLISEVLAQVQGEYDENEKVIALLERRFPGFSYAGADAGERRRVISFFLRRGYGMASVMRVLKAENNGSITLDTD